MEKNRWSLIFIGLCLALAFSVSPAEAQVDPCDRDGDNYVKDTKKCRQLFASGTTTYVGVDCNYNDNDPDNDCDGSGGGEAKVAICHKLNNVHHCFGTDGNRYGGAVRLVQASQVQRHLDNHLSGGGDCTEEEGFDAFIACANHCVCDDDVFNFGPFTEGPPE